MADITNLFKATVKTLRVRQKSLGSNLVDSSCGSAPHFSTGSIFPHVKQKGEFATKAKDVVAGITKLRDFLLDHRKAYLNSASMLLAERAAMTDSERDQIDNDAQTFIKTCSEAIRKLKTHSASNAKVLPQAKEHRDTVFFLIDNYLKGVCKIYSEQRAVRVKRVVDRKRIARLEPEAKLPRRALLNTDLPSQEGQQSESNLKQNEKGRLESAMEGSASLFGGEDEPLSAEEAQMFEQENEQLYEEMNSMVDEVKKIEGKVVEISRLQEIFTEKVLEQEKDIDRIADTVVGTTENIKEANEEIREAMKNNAGVRIWILFFLIVMSFTLLFLDWYNP